jgi:hypothetical protein
MKVRKGTYVIATSDGKQSHDGSYIKHYPFLIHREEGKTGTCQWNISHMATGYSVRKNLTLKRCKDMARRLKGFAVFHVPTVETFTQQLQLFRERKPDQHRDMMKVINPDNGE